MKYLGVPFLLLLLLPEVACAQGALDDRALSLPNPDEIRRITIEPGILNWYTPESLLKLLPRFVASKGTYLEEKFPQRGTFVLKNGVVLHWMATNYYSIEIETKAQARLFILPAECGLTGPEKGLAALRASTRPVFHHSGDIMLSFAPEGPAIRLSYMPLEDKLDKPNAPGLSAEFRCENGLAVPTISLQFWATRRLGGQSLAVVADGQVLKKIILRKPTDASLEDLGLIVYTINLPRSAFLKLTEAKEAEVRAGEKTFVLDVDHLEALRDLASRMEK